MAKIKITIEPYTLPDGSEWWRYTINGAAEGEATAQNFPDHATAKAAAEAIALTLHRRKVKPDGTPVPPDPRTETYDFDPTAQGAKP